MNSKDLQKLHSEFIRAAAGAGLLIFKGLPTLANSSPSIFWSDRWEEYIEFAKRAGVQIVYAYTSKYDADSIINEAVEDRIHTTAVYDDDEADEEVPSDGGADWLRSELHDALTPFAIHVGDFKSMSAVWFKEGVAHISRLRPIGCPMLRKRLSAFLKE